MINHKPVRWLKVKLDPSDVKCDVCGNSASTAYLLPYVTECTHIAIGCAAHVPYDEGYDVDLERFLAPNDNFRNHLKSKCTRDNPNAGLEAVGMLDARLLEFCEIGEH